jgi:V/A-type H+-transporting ATPase subunit C
MYARVSAKRAKLLERNDYEKLIKMEPNEIARNLQEGDYKEDMDALGSRYDGVRLVELALSRNLSRTLSDIVEMSSGHLEEAVQTYLRRYDIMSIKRLLRWKRGGEKERIEDLFVPVSSFDFAELKELSEKSFEEILEAVEFDSPVNYSEYIEGETDLQEIERGLDQAYFDELNRLAERIASSDFEDFIRTEMKYENLKLALRLKKYDVENSEIRNRLLKNGDFKVLDRVVDSKDIEEAKEILLEEGLISDTEMSLEDIEHELEVTRLEDALQMLHTQPLGLTSILGYVVAKIIEIKNLRMLIRAKETGIHNQETIRDNMVMRQ